MKTKMKMKKTKSKMRPKRHLARRGLPKGRRLMVYSALKHKKSEEKNNSSSQFLAGVKATREIPKIFTKRPRKLPAFFFPI